MTEKSEVIRRLQVTPRPKSISSINKLRSWRQIRGWKRCKWKTQVEETKYSGSEHEQTMCDSLLFETPLTFHRDYQGTTPQPWEWEGETGGEISRAKGSEMGAERACSPEKGRWACSVEGLTTYQSSRGSRLGNTRSGQNGTETQLKQVDRFKILHDQLIPSFQMPQPWTQNTWQPNINPNSSQTKDQSQVLGRS